MPVKGTFSGQIKEKQKDNLVVHYDIIGLICVLAKSKIGCANLDMHTLSRDWITCFQAWLFKPPSGR